MSAKHRRRPSMPNDAGPASRSPDGLDPLASHGHNRLSSSSKRRRFRAASGVDSGGAIDHAPVLPSEHPQTNFERAELLPEEFASSVVYRHELGLDLGSPVRKPPKSDSRRPNVPHILSEEHIDACSSSASSFLRVYNEQIQLLYPDKPSSSRDLLSPRMNSGRVPVQPVRTECISEAGLLSLGSPPLPSGYLVGLWNCPAPQPVPSSSWEASLSGDFDAGDRAIIHTELDLPDTQSGRLPGTPSSRRGRPRSTGVESPGQSGSIPSTLPCDAGKVDLVLGAYDTPPSHQPSPPYNLVMRGLSLERSADWQSSSGPGPIHSPKRTVSPMHPCSPDYPCLSQSSVDSSAPPRSRTVNGLSDVHRRRKRVC